MAMPPAAVPMPSARASQASALLEKKQEMAFMEEKLSRKKIECRERTDQCIAREMALAARQEELKERVQKFDKFLRDNDTKRNRAQRRKLEELKIYNQKLVEIEALNATLAEVHAERDAAEKRLHGSTRCEQFLLRVCDVAEYFHEINDVILRYETLRDVEAHVRERIDEAQARTEATRVALAQFSKEAQTETLVRNSDVVTAQGKLDSLRHRAGEAEADTNRAEMDAKERSREYGEMTMAIFNLRARCAASRASAVAQAASPIALLTDIEERVLDLQAITAAHGVGIARGAVGASQALPASAAIAGGGPVPGRGGDGPARLPL